MTSQTLPLVPLRGFVVFPDTTFQLVVGRPRSLRALDCASRRGNLVFLAAQRDQSIDDPGPGDVEPVGSICDIVQKVKHRPSIICTIVQTLRRRDNPVRVTLNGLSRGSALEFKESQGFFEVVVRSAPREWEPSSGELDAERVSTVRALFDRCVKGTRNPRWDEVLVALARIDDPGRIADIISSCLPVSVEQRQRLLEISSVDEQLEGVLDILQTEIDGFHGERATPASHRERP